jgi:dTDP-4-amino-4,6-dideoxygalactose transaminase
MATTLAILAVGAKPIFVDVNENGLLNLDLIESQINQKTKAILPVHLYGQNDDLARLKLICHQHNLALIEDACQAHGTAINGKKAGSYGDIGCFSFYPTKNLGALGDGGAITTNRDDLANKCRQIRDYGQIKKYVHQSFGINSRLDEMQAAFLRTKLKHLDKDNQRRRVIAELYRNSLKKLTEVEIIGLPTWENNNFHLMVIKTNRRDQLHQFLNEALIPTLIHYPRIIPDQPLFKDRYKNLDLPVARKLCDQVLSLPCHPFLTDEQVKFIGKKIVEFFRPGGDVSDTQ